MVFKIYPLQVSSLLQEAMFVMGIEDRRDKLGDVFFFFLSGFSFTNIHESQDCRGRGSAFL